MELHRQKIESSSTMHCFVELIHSKVVKNNRTKMITTFLGEMNFLTQIALVCQLADCHTRVAKSCNIKGKPRTVSFDAYSR